MVMSGQHLEGTTVFRNVGNHLPFDTTWHPSRSDASAPPLWEPRAGNRMKSKHRMVWLDSTMDWEGLFRKVLCVLHGNALAYERNNREAMKNSSQDRRCQSRHLKRVYLGQTFVFCVCVCVCVCETWSFALKGKYTSMPKGFENGLLRMIFGHRGEQKMFVIYIVP
jgi:hypothetical protein